MWERVEEQRILVSTSVDVVDFGVGAAKCGRASCDVADGRGGMHERKGKLKRKRRIRKRGKPCFVAKQGLNASETESEDGRRRTERAWKVYA